MPLPKPSLTPSGIPRLYERSTFAYFEHSRLSVTDSALVAITESGKAFIPPTAFWAVFLGGGCSITTEAVRLLSDSGTPLVWVSNGVVRMLSNARPLNTRSHTAAVQARSWADRDERLRVVRSMYRLRFGDGFVVSESDTLQTLQGREGSRVRARYVELSSKYDVPWSRRRNRNITDENDPVNVAMSVAHALYNGMAACVVSGLGLIPQLGFIHSHSHMAFPLDISDIFKSASADETVFRMFGNDSSLLSAEQDELGRVTRHVLRSQMLEDRLMYRTIDTTLGVLGLSGYGTQDTTDDERSVWWDGTAEGSPE